MTSIFSSRSTERLFQAAGEETANAWGPIVTVQVHGTKSRQAAAERSWERPLIALTGVKYPARYEEQNRVNIWMRGNRAWIELATAHQASAASHEFRWSRG